MRWSNVIGFFRNLGRQFRTLPYRSRHIAAWGLVKAERAAGRSYTQTVNDMVRLHLMRPKSPFQDDLDAYVGMLDRQASLIGWPDDLVPGFDQVVDMAFRRAEHFRWIIHVNVEPGGGYEGGWRFISLYTNRLMTTRDLMDALGLYIRAGSESLQYRVRNYEVWAIQHNPGAPWGAF